MKIVPELLQSRIKILELYGTTRFFDEFPSLPQSTKKIVVSPPELQKISFLTTSNEVLAVCEIPQVDLDLSEMSEQLTLVLDDLRDPGNLGTIVRVADWFGISTILCSRGTVDVYNPKVVQATMGSISRVNVHYLDLEDFLSHLPGEIPVYGAVLDGKNVFRQNLSATGLLIIGNESRGISESLSPFIGERIRVPSFHKGTEGSSDSLNAAVAASILCAEFRRGLSPLR